MFKIIQGLNFKPLSSDSWGIFIRPRTHFKYTIHQRVIFCKFFLLKNLLYFLYSYSEQRSLISSDYARNFICVLVVSPPENWRSFQSFFDIQGHGKLAEVLSQTKKGQGIRIVGRLKQERWQDQEGKFYSKVRVIAEHTEIRPFREVKQETKKNMDYDVERQ